MRFGKSAVVAIALLTASLLTAQKAARPAITGVSHMSVYTTDSAKTEYFYVHDLGAVKRDDPEISAGARYYFNATQFIEVLPFPAGYTSINRLDHVAFDTADANRMRQYLAQSGITVPDKVQDGSDGSHWFHITDAEGNKVEFVQPPASPMPVVTNPLTSHIIHMGYLMHDADVQNKLYRDVLGFRPYWYGGGSDGFIAWRAEQVPDGTDWIEFMMVRGPEKTGIPADMKADRLGVLDHFSLGVINMENTVILLTNGDRLSGRREGTFGGGAIGRDGKWQFNLFDPDGTRAELMEYGPVSKPCCSEFTGPHPTPPTK